MPDVPNDIDESKLPWWIPRWFAQYVVRQDVSKISRLGKWCIGIVGVVIFLITVADAFGPGYCSVARAIIFLPVCLFVCLLIACMMGRLSFPPRYYPLAFCSAYLVVHVLRDLRTGGFYRVVDEVIAMMVVWAILSIPWKRLFGRREQKKIDFEL